MSTHLSWRGAILLACALAAPAQISSPWANPADAVSFRASAETSIELAEKDFSRTEISVRGPAAVVDLRCRLTLTNSSSRTLRAVTLAVHSVPGAPGGKAVVVSPSLSAGPGERALVDVNLRLVRPLPSAGQPLAEIVVDGVLYADLSFRGPDEISSRRRMTLLELEAREDRKRLAQTLSARGPEALRAQVLDVLERQASRPDFEVRLAGGDGRSVSPAVRAGMRPVELAFLDVDETPLELLDGSALAGGGRAVSPSIEVRNRSGKAIRDFEVGWLVHDVEGRRYAAGAVPSTGGQLEAGRVGSVEAQRLFEFRLRGPEPFEIGGMSGYVRRVEFADGTLWAPSREALDRASLLDVEPLSSEESRLAAVYRSQGLQALIAELARF